jgi:DNA polymerase III delta' subunit
LETPLSEQESVAPLDLLPWQAPAWARLAGARAAGKLTHAWVVLGRPGIGKRQFVACAAAAWLCASPDARGLACGRCDSCRMLAAGGHPDAHLLGTDGHVGLSANARLSREDSLVHWEPAKDSKRREIAVEGVRSLIEKLSVVSHRGGARIVAITPAEALNEASANALLKLIEEPPTGCQLFLIAEQAASLKPTLLSRCQRLLLPLPAPPDAEAWLRQQRPDAAADDCAAALRLSRAAAAPARVDCAGRRTGGRTLRSAAGGDPGRQGARGRFYGLAADGARRLAAPADRCGGRCRIARIADRRRRRGEGRASHRCHPRHAARAGAQRQPAAGAGGVADRAAVRRRAASGNCVD